jgi:hypothetical protein
MMDDEVGDLEGVNFPEFAWRKWREKTTDAIEPMFLRSVSMVCIWSRGSSVSVVSRLRAGRSGDRILTQARDFLSSRKRPDLLRLPSSIIFKRYRVSIAP